MAFCSACGTNLPAGARFCPECGVAVSGQAAPITEPQATPGSAAAPPARGASPVVPGATPVTGGGGGAGLILPIMIIVGLAVIGLFLWSQRSEERSRVATRDAAAEQSESASAADDAKESETVSASSDGAAQTSAASLDSAFHANPEGARARYSGSLTVTGVVATMVMPGSTPAIAIEGRTRLNLVVVNFPAGYRDRLSRLAKGDRITVTCDGVRALAGTTLLQGCALAG
ncbi:zinc-ribbon domain-containing protein [Sphingosinicella sp. BN140058]|uniref:OB-fold protein n=1 Tax=Sphingosinicella sp. BN140058 TaxID=1892855 RepID=UPI0013EDD2BF|nr:zinc-ribbon domain-containing protein [Sphingosinicella sp. BN140058]